MNRPLVCLTLTGKTLEENVRLAKKYEKLVDIVELRVDFLEEDERLYVRRFPSMILHPCILTIRRDVDGGLYTGGEFSRTHLFGRALAFANPDKSKNFAYVDFEDDYHIPSMQDAAMAFGVRIIRSYYNFNGIVRNLRARCDSMLKTGYEIPKIAFKPNSLSDMVNLFNEGRLMTQYDHILLALGNQGLPSSVLASVTNSFLTYVAPEETLANTADIGLIDPYTLNDIYNFKDLNRNTQLFGITGWPLTKTGSPAIHNDAYKRLGINAVYLPLKSELISETLNFAEQTNFKGLAIANPFKESVLYYIHDHSEEVTQIGACNTVVLNYDRWIGYNTDAYGFKKALLEFVGPNFKFKRLKVAVIGAGGAAKSVVYILNQLGAKVCIFNRSEERAQALAERYGYEYAKLSPECAPLLDEYSNLIIQATSLGMYASGPTSSENDPATFYNFRGNELLFDVVFTPAMTPIMKRASLAGCKVCNGYKMLEYQAEAQFKLFTKRDFN